MQLCTNAIAILMKAGKLKEVKKERNDTHRYIMVRRSSSFCLLHSPMMLKNHREIITVYHYFGKLDTSTLIIMKHHTIIPFVDANTQIANKKQDPQTS